MDDLLYCLTFQGLFDELLPLFVKLCKSLSSCVLLMVCIVSETAWPLNQGLQQKSCIGILLVQKDSVEI